jgi:hypothetical protein
VRPLQDRLVLLERLPEVGPGTAVAQGGDERGLEPSHLEGPLPPGARVQCPWVIFVVSWQESVA